MLTPAQIQALFKEVQENALAAIWSQGVNLTRGASSFVASRLEAEECVIHVRTPGHPVSPKVTLWPAELDWDCDCPSSESPCPHVAATLILLKRGEIKAASAAETDKPAGAESDIARLHYVFLRTPQGLRLERRLVGAGLSRTLDIPLVNYKAGVESKRLQAPDVMASKADFAVDLVLRSYQGGPLERLRLESLFRDFDSDQLVFLEEAPIKISSSRVLAQYECVDEADGYRLRRVKNPLITETFRHGVALFSDTLRLMNSTQLTPDEQRLVENDGSYWGPEKEKLLFSQVIPQLQKKINIVVSSLKRPQTLELTPWTELRLEKDEDPVTGEIGLSVLANVVYGEPPIALLNYNTLELVPAQDSRSQRVAQVVQRLPAEERLLMQKLARELDLQPGRRIFLKDADAIKFVERAKGWPSVGGGAELFRPAAHTLTPRIEVSQNEGYAMRVSFVASGGGESRADFDTVYKAWQNGSDNVPLIDGKWAQLPKDWMKRYARRIAEFLTTREALEKTLPSHKLPELARLCDDLGATYPDSLKQMRRMLDDFTGIRDYPLPRDLTASLRSYQRKGVNWLCFLRESRMGAMLADDMGLGKTLQALCALEGKCLVIAPTSVIHNWAAEIKKFRPSMQTSLFYGSKRVLDETADVVLTSYGVMRLDQELLAKREWDTIVIDEAQTIKNPDSLVAKAAHALKGKFRIALSGTPVENRLDDLWSQFHFVNPGLLGRRDEFLENYARPIGQGDVETASKLKGRIKPFILRRLKREVAPELPPRTETVLRCELTIEERQTYEMLMASTRKEVLATLEEGSGGILKALEAILRLRQACCHRALIPGENATSSSKLDLLMETLEESLSEGHKSLVFSQWTSYLDLIAAEFKKRGIRYSRIDGSTQNRQALVNEFQGPEGPPIMLISLKAGGVGLTLTAADHVFITDSWWNPSVEDQAADRAHRIGQQNPVMIHRLVANDSIEEKILALQESKKDLARAVLDEGGAALSLTRQDILNLLS
jgi:superfamily II DNA or RNA helicase